MIQNKHQEHINITIRTLNIEIIFYRTKREKRFFLPKHY